MPEIEAKIHRRSRNMISYVRNALVFVIVFSTSFIVEANYVCKNKLSEKNCELYAKDGRCRLTDAYREFMKKNCAKSCGFCQVKASLTFKTEPESLVIGSGKNATFHCEAEVLQPTSITYFWKHNGTYIDVENSTSYSYLNGSLTVIGGDEAGHTGTYQCVAVSTKFGAILSRPAKLQISYFEITPMTSTFYIRIMPKHLLIKAPGINAMPMPLITWQSKRGSNTYKPISDPSIYQTIKGDLLFSSVAANHTRQYRVLIKDLTNGVVVYGIVTLRVRCTVHGCPNKTIIIYPSANNVTVAEGGNVTLECLAVAASCTYNLAISWRRKLSSKVISTSRRLHIANIAKQDEGIYFCSAEVENGISKSRSYSIKVIEKPKLVETPNPKIILKNGELLEKASVHGAKSFSWYTNGEEIKTSTYFSFTANGALNVSFPSQAYGGTYQQFFENEAGITVVTQDVVFNTSGCGYRLSGTNGMIEFQGKRNKNWPNNVTCTWVIQLSTTTRTPVQFSRYSFPLAKDHCRKTAIEIFSGLPVARNRVVRYCITTGQPFPVVYPEGPFLTLVLDVFNTYLENGGFTVHFGDYHPSTTVSTKSAADNLTTSVVTKNNSMFSTASSILSNNNKNENRIGAITGGAVAALVFVSSVLAVIFVLRRKNRLGSVSIRGSHKRRASKQKSSLPRFDIRRKSKDTENSTLSSDLESTPSEIPYQLGHIGPCDSSDNLHHDTYDSVGSIISNGGSTLGQDNKGQKLLETRDSSIGCLTAYDSCGCCPHDEE
eukprot:gene8884-9834_t